MINEFIDDAPHSANYGAVGGSGSGAQAVSILVLDTSGADAAIAGVKVTIYLDGYTGTALVATANGSGIASFSLDASTAYDVLVGPLGGYIFDAYDMTTGSGATFTDTVMGYDVNLGTSSTPNVCRVSGRVVELAGNPVKGATVYIDVEGGDAAPSNVVDTANNINFARYGRSTTSDANGDWYLDRVYSASFTPALNYQYRFEKRGLIALPLTGVTITVPSQATARIEDLIVGEE